MITIPYIGFIKSSFAETTDPDIMRKQESELIVYEQFSDGLFTLESNEYIEVFFHFHKAGPFNDEGFFENPNRLKTYTRTGKYRGIFATRTPSRPSQIGNTIVKLIERKGNMLRVTGLDALDGTPLVDIKPLHIPLTPEELERLNKGRKMEAK
jgi:formylmethanofuran dehydrogenase subunit E